MDKSAHHHTDAGHEAADERRQHPRVRGPFHGLRLGLLDTPVHIFDLSLGGCFVNSMHEEEKGVICTLVIDLGVDQVKVKGETVYRRPGFGFALRFIQMDRVTTKRLQRALAKVAGQRSRT